jgi:LysM repeat protein
VIEGETDKAGNPIRRAATAQRHVVRKGETLASIAKDNHLEVARLAKMKGLKPQASIKPGRKLVVVADGNAETKADTAKPSSSATATLQSAKSSRGTKAHSSAPQASTREIRYQVKHGDTLHGLSRKFSVTAAQLKAWNRLGNTLTVGETIVVKVPLDRDFGG